MESPLLPDAAAAAAMGAAAAKHEQEERRQQQLLACQHSCITVMGWAFDIISLALSLTDVIADVLVAIQFWQDGHMGLGLAHARVLHQQQPRVLHHGCVVWHPPHA